MCEVQDGACIHRYWTNEYLIFDICVIMWYEIFCKSFYIKVPKIKYHLVMYYSDVDKT